MATRDEMLDRIRKLLNHAKGDGHHSEGEIENAMGLARKLMNKWGIEESEVLLNPEKARQVSVRDHDACSRKGKIEIFDAELAIVVEKICDVRGYFQLADGWWGRTLKGKSVYRGGREHLHFVGLERDVAVAAEFYKELHVTIRTMARLRQGSKWTPAHTDYCLGFVRKLIQRARAAKQSSQDGVQAGAIILAKDAIVNRWIEENLSMGGAREATRETRDWAAYHQGAADGANASLETNGLRGEKPSKPVGQIAN